MPFHFDLYALVIAAGAAQALLLVFALAARRLFRVNSFCFFAAFLLSLTCILAFSVLYYNGYALAHPHLLRVHHPVNFLAAPLFFLFVKYFVAPRPEVRPADWLHFGAALAFGLYLLPFFGLDGAAKVHRWTHPDPLVNRLETGFFLGQQLLYIGWTMRLLRREPVMRLWQQPALRPGLGYIRLLTYSYAGVWVLRLLGEAAGRTNPLEKISTSLVAVLVYLLAYQLLKNAKSFFPTANPAVAKAMPAGMASELAGKLDGLMQAEKPFKDGELSLAGLAERLSVSPHQLSETLNQTIGKNFNEYVNDFRVEEAKALLVHPAYRHYSILAVAYEAGFPSKSVFYKVFKDKTGQSPSAYIKAQGRIVEG